MKKQFIVEVDGEKSIEALVSKMDYAFVNDVNSRNFRSKHLSRYEVEFKLFCFNEIMPSYKAFSEMESEGFRPATAHELISFVIANPRFKRLTIVALNDCCDVLWQAQGLYGMGVARNSFSDGYGSGVYFAGVRK